MHWHRRPLSIKAVDRHCCIYLLVSRFHCKWHAAWEYSEELMLQLGKFCLEHNCQCYVVGDIVCIVLVGCFDRIPFWLILSNYDTYSSESLLLNCNQYMRFLL